MLGYRGAESIWGSKMKPVIHKTVKRRILMMKGDERAFWSPTRRKVRKARKRLVKSLSGFRVKVGLLILPEDVRKQISND